MLDNTGKAAAGERIMKRALDPWTVKDLVRTFNELNEAKFTAETCNFLKSHGISATPEPTFSFRPTINEVSKVLAGQNNEKYITEIQSRYKRS